VVIYGALEKLKLIKTDLNIFSLTNFSAAGAFFLFFFLIWLATRGRGMGLGDSKLALLIGLIFGVIGGIIVIYTAIMLGFIVGLTLLLATKASLKTKLPFGTFLGISACLYLIMGYGIIIREFGSISLIINFYK